MANAVRRSRTGDENLKSRLKELRSVRDSAKADADRAEARLSGGAPQLTPEIIQRFASEAKARMRRANVDYRRHHLQAIAQRIEVGEDVIRIKGTRTNLLRTIVGKEAGPSPEGMGGVSKGGNRAEGCGKTVGAVSEG